MNGKTRLVALGALLQLKRLLPLSRRFRLSSPANGGMEDFHADMTGASGVLFLSPDKHW